MIGVETPRRERLGPGFDERGMPASTRPTERDVPWRRTQECHDPNGAARRIALRANPEINRAGAIPPTIVLIRVRRLIRAIAASQLVLMIHEVGRQGVGRQC